MITLYKPEDETEAIAIAALLEENSISSSMQSFRDTAYDGVFQGQHGWGLIKVNDSDFEAAAKLLADWRSGTPDKNEMDRATDSAPPQKQANVTSQRSLLKPALISISVLMNIVLVSLYLSFKWKKPTDYEIYDTDGKRLGVVEWGNNKIFPYKYITYLQNGKASYVSIDSKDSGRPDKLVVLQGSLKSTFKDEDGNGVYEYYETEFDSGSKIQYWDSDQNGIYEKSTIITAKGKTYNFTHSNKNGFDLMIRTPSGEELSFDVLKLLVHEM